MKHLTKILQNYQISLIATLFLLCLAFPGVVSAATLSLSPDTGVFTVGGTFSARVIVNTQGSPVNAAEAGLKFNPNELSVVSISKGSLFNLWAVEPTFSNSAGTISFGGGSTTGYTGSQGTVLTITFRIKTAAASRVTFSTGSVLAADGIGTNVLRNMTGGTYTSTAVSDTPTAEVVEYVAPANTPAAPVISSASHADPEGWSNTSSAVLSWSLPSGVVAVRTLLSESASAIPTKVYEPAIANITLDDLEDGEQYFHLQFRNDDGWGKVASYRLGVDTQKPEAWSVSFDPDVPPSSPLQTLLIEGEDDGSPVERFLVKVNDEAPFEFIDVDGERKVPLPALTPGYHVIIVEMFDAAGNSVLETFSLTIESFAAPLFTEYPVTVNAGNIPVFKGVSQPEVAVTATLRRLGDDDTSDHILTATANKEGEFYLITDGSLASGVYELSATAQAADGAQSAQSEVVRFKVEQAGYVRLGVWAISFLSVLVPLVALVLMLGLLFWYSVHRVRSIRTYVVTETSEALDILEREFNRLHVVLDEAAAKAAATRKSNELTKAEKSFVETVAQQVTTTHDILKKEIADVDDIVN